APFVWAGAIFPWLPVFQAAVGAALVAVVFSLARELFDARVGLVAATVTAFSPYAIVHDTAMQETVVVNVLIASGALCLARSRRPRSPDACRAGACFALATLTTARVAVLVPAALLWVLSGAGTRQRAGVIWVRAAAFGLPAFVLLGGWIARNAVVIGAPRLT